MLKEPQKYRTLDEYRNVADTLYATCGMILLALENHNCSTKDILIRNFVARAAVGLKGIFALWDISDYQDAWMIHRSILDRMFHLRSIGDNDEFTVFDDWSFYEQYKAQNKVKNDPDFKHEAVGWIYDLTSEQKKKASNLSESKPVWRRPKAETVAKNMGMLFLYNFGYDYASTHVHPMANDGQQDFFTVTNIKPAKAFPSNITVLSNSILATTIILQDAMNFSSFKWRKLIWDLLDQYRLALRSDDESYMLTFLKLAECSKTESLCEPSKD